jgi:hypothetical protein
MKNNLIYAELFKFYDRLSLLLPIPNQFQNFKISIYLYFFFGFFFFCCPKNVPQTYLETLYAYILSYATTHWMQFVLHNFAKNSKNIYINHNPTDYCNNKFFIIQCNH